MKKLIPLLVISLILAVGNFFLWQLSLKNDVQLAWIAFVLVWLNLILTWFTHKKQPQIAYIFLTSSFVVEIMLAVNYFWIQKESRFL